jgi:hypothetical protein
MPYLLLASTCLMLVLGNAKPFQFSAAKDHPSITTAAEEAPIEVQELRSPLVNGTAWSVAQTTNFHVFHRESPELAASVARAAERARTITYRRWFGRAPSPWQLRCDIYLYPTARDYSMATGVPEVVPGHSTFQYDSGRLVSRRIDLHCDCPTMVSAVLPHETTHAVLQGMFDKEALPRWANEGMATLGEPRPQISGQIQRLPRFRDAGQLLDTQALMETKNYPLHHVAAFYAQSVSLVSFLTASKKPQVFTQFLREANEAGYEKALQDHYGWSFPELERRWRAYAFREDGVVKSIP